MSTPSIFSLVSTTEKPALVSYVEHTNWLEVAEKYFNHLLTVLQFFGFTLNIFHFLVLTRKGMRCIAVYRLMIGICVFDLISQISTFLLWSPFLIRSPPPAEQECFLSFTYFDVMTQVYAGCVLDVTQRNSSWLALLMALFRTVSVMFPMSSIMQKLSKPRVAVWTILIVLVVSVLWTLEAYSRFEIKSYDKDTE